MRSYAAYLHPDAQPVLLRDGFSLAALVFGPFWLLAQRAWIPAALVLCAEILLAVLAPAAFRLPCLAALAWFVGLTGRDMVAWSLERGGFDFTHVIAARDEDGAYARLMLARPDLLADLPRRDAP